MAAIYSNGGNRWNILGFNFNKRDALSIVYIRYLCPRCVHVIRQLRCARLSIRLVEVQNNAPVLKLFRLSLQHKDISCK